jgi:hypothetical protein
MKDYPPNQTVVLCPDCGEPTSVRVASQLGTPQDPHISVEELRQLYLAFLACWRKDWLQTKYYRKGGRPREKNVASTGTVCWRCKYVKPFMHWVVVAPGVLSGPWCRLCLRWRSRDELDHGDGSLDFRVYIMAGTSETLRLVKNSHLIREDPTLPTEPEENDDFTTPF